MLAYRAVAVLALFTVSATLDAQRSRWFRGNTHTHTLQSDGDSPPDSAARWYRDHGYNFLLITDHERLTDPAPLNAQYGRAGAFLLIAGQEVTQRVADSTRKENRQAHMNALGIHKVVMPQGTNGVAKDITMAEGYRRNIAAIRAAGGIPQINHPNWRWSVRLSDLLAIPDSTLIEIANAHTGVNNLGAANADGRVVPSTEALWDSLLSRGKVLFAVGDDDSHSFRPGDADDYNLTRPGRSWIMVRANTLTASAILGAIRRGDFYVSTGVMLSDLTVSSRSIRLAIEATGSDDRQFTIEWVGRGGRVLSTATGREASYQIRGDEGYVRARITDSNGKHAWTQPVVEGQRSRVKGQG